MSVAIVLAVFAIASIVYVYRFRGQVRYASFGEYVRKGWPIFSPFNCVLYMTTLPRAAKPIIDPAEFPELDALRVNWRDIRDEGRMLMRHGYFDATKRPGTPGYYDVGFRTFFKYGWSRFYLGRYGYTHRSAQRLCPKTVAILREVPVVRGAMFALLPPHSRLTRHADPIAISLRYHLGLATPNSDSCFIEIDGQRRVWRDGAAILFDETYLHYVRNDTDEDRLILMCDVARPLNPVGAAFNWFYGAIARASVVPNMPEDERGLANRAFSRLSPLLAQARSLKAVRPRVYFAMKWSVNALLVLLPLGLVVYVAQLIGELV